MSQAPQIEKLLKEVKGSLIEVDRIEEEYKNSKMRTRELLIKTISRLAALADTQAIRAQILRELYWKLRISTDVIGEGFKLEMGRIRLLAGRYTTQFPCYNRCGNSIQITFKARSALEHHEALLRKGRAWDRCADCKRREQEEARKEHSEREIEDAKLASALRAMDWPDFIETGEWIELRNSALEQAGYGCEICSASDESLYVCLHKDTTEYPLPVYRLFISFRGHARFFILCDSCLKRCEDLIHPVWREKLKAEFIKWIKAERGRR